MNTVLLNYEKFSQNKHSNWENRFTWRKGKIISNSTSINRYNAETLAFSNIKIAKNTNELFSIIEDTASDYVYYVKSKGYSYYNSKDYADLRNFFVGAIGEYFFYFLLTELHAMDVFTSYDEMCRIDFNYVAPALPSVLKKDLGVDMTCYANDTPSVLQIKFYNPNIKSKFRVKEIVQSMCAEGSVKNIINTRESSNMYICHIGKESVVYNWIKKFGEFYRKNVICIGENSLNYTVNNKNTIFWQKFHKSLSELK